MLNETRAKLVVVGSVAVDWVITPAAERQNSVGGAAVFFAMAASPMSKVALVGIIGHDFPSTALEDLQAAGVDLEGLERSEGLTFRWKGRYHENMNHRDTLETHLNVFERFSPKLPQSYRECEFLFLANIQPSLQLDVLDQMAKRPHLVGLDTMNLWIDIARDSLLKVLRRVDVLLINEEEAMQLSGEHNLVKAARAVQRMGPSSVVVKRGEYGALLFHGDDMFSAPALPLEEVIDPTGAGDAFAGGFMGWIARAGEPAGEQLRTAMIYGSTLASFLVQGFSYEGIRRLGRATIQERFAAFARLTDFRRAELT